MSTHTRRAAAAPLFVLVLLVAAQLVPAAGLAAPQPAQRGSNWEPAPCGEFESQGLSLGTIANLECGYVRVPEAHASPDGQAIRLGTVILKATDGSRADPLFMAQGGPGGSTIDTYALLMLDSPLRADRDIVLFDQRGTRYAEPSLACPELDELVRRTIEQELTVEEEIRLSNEALAQCRARLASEGVNLSAFDSVENARDVDAVRQTLGYGQIDLYGVSYGTLLAQQAMRYVPDGLRSVIIDAVVPAAGNQQQGVARGENRALSELFGACAADARCNAAYPDLERVYYEQVERLERQPARMPVTDRESGASYQAVLTGRLLQDLVFQLMYATELLPMMPLLIDDVRAERYDLLGSLASLLIFDDSVAEGMYYSVSCAEDYDVDPTDLGEGLRPQVVERAERYLENFVEVCQAWDVERLEPRADQAVESDIPTLILNGRFDPITPPSNGEAVAAGLPRSFSYTFPNTAHGALTSEPCAEQIAASFLADPTAQPDDACLAGLGGPAFVVPGDLLRIPALVRLANLEGGSVAELTTFGIALLVLLSAWLVLPIAWLVRLASRSGSAARPPAPPLARAAPWLLLAAGALLFLFTGGLLVAVLTEAERAPITLLVGLPGRWSWLFTLPIAALIAVLGALAGVVAAWRAGAWPPLSFVYRGLLVLAGLTCTTVLAVWGMFGTPLLG